VAETCTRAKTKLYAVAGNKTSVLTSDSVTPCIQHEPDIQTHMEGQLELIVKKRSVGVWSGFIWLRTQLGYL
jgi:hypothetical protein